MAPRRPTLGKKTQEEPRVEGARDDGSRIGGPPARLPRLLLFAALLCVRGSLAEIVTDGDVTVARGEKVALLRCTLRGTAALLQVSWLKAASGNGQDKTNLAVFSPQHGISYPSSPYLDRVRFRNKDPQKDASLELLDVMTGDEGVFFCQMSTFPTGNFEGRVNLSVVVKPKLSLEATPGVTVTDGETEAVVATCRAAEGKPPASLAWSAPATLLALRGNQSERREVQPDGTVTVTSEFRVVPTRAADAQLLRCTATHPALPPAGETLDVTLSVQYAPEVTAIDGFDNNWYVGRLGATLVCHAVGNPAPTVSWKMINVTMPGDVRRLGNSLSFSQALTRAHAGVYACEAVNTLGTRLGVIEVEIRDQPAAREAGGGSVGAILGGIIGAILIIALVVTAVLFYRRRKPEGTPEEAPPSHKPPPPSKKSDHGSNIRMMPLENDNKDEELQKMPLQSQYYDTGAPNSNYPDHTGSDKEYNIQYAELDTAALSSSSAGGGGGPAGAQAARDVVEYATIQPN